MAVFSISYDQLVGPDLILFGEFHTADAIALSDGMKAFLGELGEWRRQQVLMVANAGLAIAGRSPCWLELVAWVLGS